MFRSRPNRSLAAIVAMTMRIILSAPLRLFHQHGIRLRKLVRQQRGYGLFVMDEGRDRSRRGA